MQDPDTLGNASGFIYLCIASYFLLNETFDRPRCEIWPVFSCRPGFGRFWAILDTFGKKWYNLSSGRKYGLKTKIRPK